VSELQKKRDTARLEKKVGGAIRGSISNCSRASQAVLLQAMSGESYEREKREKFDILRGRALKVKDVLGQDRYAAAWTPYPFNSGYFMCLKLKRINAERFRLRLLDDHGIGVISISDRDIRVAFSCVEEEEIPDLFDQMFLCAGKMADEA